MNIEHRTHQRRTVSIEHPMLNYVLCQFRIKTEQAYFANLATKARSESTLRNSTRLPSTSSWSEHVEGSSSQAAIQYSAIFISRLQRDSLVLKSIKRSVIH
jgi:hypothetical protein